MKLVIDRTKWLRGEGSMNSFLLRDGDEKQCCIGFLCEALGVPREKLKDEKGSQVLLDVNLPDWLQTKTSKAQEQTSDLFIAYAVNDYNGEDSEVDETPIVVTSEEDREARIAEIFARHDVQVEFVG